MKKRILFGWMGVLLMVLATACSDGGSDEPKKPTEPVKVTITQGADVLVETKGGEKVLAFTANQAWTAQCNQSWCTLEQTKGSAGKITLAVTVAANDTYDERVATITIHAGTASATAKVTQTQKDAIIVAKKEYAVVGAASELGFDIQANVEFKVSANVDWIKQVTDKSRGLKTYPLNFSVAANTLDKEREGVITISAGDLKQTVKVVQQPKGKEKSQVAITHTCKLFEVPVFKGTDVLATILWGDKQQEAYKPGATHTYEKVGTYKVTIEVENAEEMMLKTLEGVTGIDLSKF